MLKKTLIGFAVLLVVVIGGALIAPSFIDWNARLPEIVAQVKATTGRDLTVDGRLEVSLLPAPMLTARGVKLGNAPGGAASHLVALEAVEVRVALLPLLSGQVQVERIRLVRPQINVETFADGSTNLEFQAAPDSAPTPSSVQNGASETLSADTDNAAAGLGLRLDHFEIIDATVVYQDAEGTIERIEGLNTTLRAASLQGPFEAQGAARLRNVPISFEVSLGQMISGRTIPTMTAQINAPGGTRVNISGAILEMEVAPRFKGKVKVEGADFAALLNAVTSAGGAYQSQNKPLSQSFALDADVNATAKDVALSELELTFGDMRATGLIDVGLVDGVTFNVDLNALRIDADALMAKMPARSSSASAESNTVAVSQPATTEEVKGADVQQGFSLPTGVNGTVSLNIEAVTLRGGLLSDVRINVELADGELALSQFQLQAPGVTDVGLFGFIRPEGGQAQFNGDLEIVTADPKGLTEWLGVQMPDNVAGRLKRLTFKSKVVADQTQVVMSGIDLNGDRTHVTGGLTLALRDRLSFGADLNVDALNVDTYLNGNGSTNGAAAGAATPTVAEQPEVKSQMAQAMDMAGMWAATSALNSFDANLKVRLGSLTQAGRVFKDVVFDGTLYMGALELRQFRVGETLGASATVNGNFKGFGGVPEMTGVQAEVKVRDANATAATLGVAGLPANIGAVTLNVRADGSLLKPSLNANVVALGGNFGAAGRVSLLTGFGWDGDVSAQHPNTVKLLAALGYVPVGPLGAMDVKAKLKTDGATHEVTDLQGNIGETRLAGTLTAKTGGAKPNVVANLSTGAFDIQRFLAQAEKHADATPSHNPLLVLASTRTDPQLAQTPSRADKRWSREKFDLSVLNSMDGELTLKSEAIQFGDYRLDNADIHATVANGVMTADRVVGQLFGGPVSGTAVVRASGQPTVESTIKLSAMEVGRAVMAVAGKDLATGNLGLDMNLSATGSSPADLVSSLNGAGGMKIDSLDAKQGGAGTALAPVIGLVSAMNQFALPAVGGAGKSKGGLADLSLGFDIKDGIATAKNLALNAAFGSGAGSGTVDIAAWLIDFSGNLMVEPNLLSSLISKGRVGKQEVPFTLKGALDKPGVNLGVRSAGSAPAAGGAPTDPVKSLLNQVLPGVIPQQQPQAQPQNQPQDGSLPPPPSQGQAPAQKKLTPEDMIKQLMKGL